MGGKTVQEDSRKISYDGWSQVASARASGGAYHQSKSQTSGATCGLFSGGSKIDLITAKGLTRGMARVRVLNVFTGNWVKDEQVNLNSPTTEWQHVVEVTGLESNRMYKLEVSSADGTPVVFDGCTGNLSGPVN